MDRALLSRVRSEFDELRGVALSLPQIARLCGLTLAECRQVLEALREDGTLRQLDDGTYRRNRLRHANSPG